MFQHVYSLLQIRQRIPRLIPPVTLPSRKNPRLKFPSLGNKHTIHVSDEHVAVWEQTDPITDDHKLAESVSVIASDLGRLIKESRESAIVSTKETLDDFVTNIDVDTEIIIRNWLMRVRPRDIIIGEEKGGDPYAFDDTTWFIDPIDGTRNFINGSDAVAIHIGAIRHGNPVVSVVALPFRDLVFSNLNPPVTRRTPPSGSILGTEFRTEGSSEHLTLNSILHDSVSMLHRKQSIGCNILDLVVGDVTVFYKPRAKLWDIIAPLGLAYQLYPNRFRMTLTFERNGNIVTSPLFGHGPEVTEYINQRHSINSRIGLVIAVPATDSYFEPLIINKVNKCMSLSC
ncbi:hypothetical protein EB093_04070 [bacterium]|nr:hypothetical protein [bacterium]